jgi:hypothetical protein
MAAVDKAGNTISSTQKILSHQVPITLYIINTIIEILTIIFLDIARHYIFFTGALLHEHTHPFFPDKSLI